MSDNSPLKIRTMADDLEKVEKKEMGAVAPSVSGASASLKNKETPSPRTSGQPVSKEKERKSLKDVLIQLGEGEKSSELSGMSQRENTEKREEGDDISGIKSILKKMDGVVQKRPSAPFSSLPAPAPEPISSLLSRENGREENKTEVQKEIEREIGREVKIKEEPQLQELPGRKEKRNGDVKEIKRETEAEKINSARDWKKEGEEILKIEKELEEKKKEIETAEKKPPLTPSPKYLGQGGKKTVAEELKPKSSDGALKKIEEAAEKTKEVSETPYLSPSARLLYNKPERYSSVSNKVKEKREEAEVSGIKDVFKHQEPRKEEKKKTPEQEYKKFKKSFKGVYQAGLAEKTSKRLILTLTIVIAIGIISVLAWSLIIKKPSEEQPLQPAPKAAVEEIKEFSLIESEILIELEKDGGSLISKINAQSARMEREKGLADISRVTVKKEEAIISLEELLVELEIEMPKDTLDLFDNNRYNLLLFKEDFGVNRLGLALATDNPSAARLKFLNWENENIASRKIYRAFEPLFLESRIYSASQEGFKTEEHLGVKMRYIQVPDKNTSLDYLFYGDILVITTSKSSAFRVVEILVSS